jgi:hypothetical protein
MPTTYHEAGGMRTGGGWMIPSVVEAQAAERQRMLARQQAAKRAKALEARLAVVGDLAFDDDDDDLPQPSSASKGGPSPAPLDVSIIAHSPALQSSSVPGGSSPSGVVTTGASLPGHASLASAASAASHTRKRAVGWPGGAHSPSLRPGTSEQGSGATTTATVKPFKLPDDERKKLAQMLAEEKQRKADASAELNFAAMLPPPGQGSRISDRAITQLSQHLRRRPHSVLNMSETEVKLLSDTGVKIPPAALALTLSAARTQSGVFENSSFGGGPPRLASQRSITSGTFGSGDSGVFLGDSGAFNETMTVAAGLREFTDIVELGLDQPDAWSFAVPGDDESAGASSAASLLATCPFDFDVADALGRVGRGISIADPTVRERLEQLLARPEAQHCLRHLFWLLTAVFFSGSYEAAAVRAGLLQRMALSLAKLTWDGRGRRSSAYLPSSLAHACCIAMYEAFPGSRQRMSQRFYARCVALALTVLTGTDVSLMHAQNVVMTLFSTSPEVALPDPVPIERNSPSGSPKHSAPLTTLVSPTNTTVAARQQHSTVGSELFDSLNPSRTTNAGPSAEAISIFNDFMLDPVYAREIIGRTLDRQKRVRQGAAMVENSSALAASLTAPTSTTDPAQRRMLLVSKPVASQEELAMRSPRYGTEIKRLALHYALAGAASFEMTTVQRERAALKSQVLAVPSIYDIDTLAQQFDAEAMDSALHEHLEESERVMTKEPTFRRSRGNPKTQRQFISFVRAARCEGGGDGNDSGSNTPRLRKTASAVWRDMLVRKKFDSSLSSTYRRSDSIPNPRMAKTPSFRRPSSSSTGGPRSPLLSVEKPFGDTTRSDWGRDGADNSSSQAHLRLPTALVKPNKAVSFGRPATHAPPALRPSVSFDHSGEFGSETGSMNGSHTYFPPRPQQQNSGAAALTGSTEMLGSSSPGAKLNSSWGSAQAALDNSTDPVLETENEALLNKLLERPYPAKEAVKLASHGLLTMKDAAGAMPGVSIAETLRSQKRLAQEKQHLCSTSGKNLSAPASTDSPSHPRQHGHDQPLGSVLFPTRSSSAVPSSKPVVTQSSAQRIPDRRAASTEPRSRMPIRGANLGAPARLATTSSFTNGGANAVTAVERTFSKSVGELKHHNDAVQRLRAHTAQHMLSGDEGEVFADVMEAFSDAPHRSQSPQRQHRPTAGTILQPSADPNEILTAGASVPATGYYSTTTLDVTALSPLAQSVLGVEQSTRRGRVTLTHLIGPSHPNAHLRAAALRKDGVVRERHRQAVAQARELELEDQLRVLETGKAKTAAELQQALSNPLRTSDAANAILASGPALRHPEPLRQAHVPFLTGTMMAVQAKATSVRLSEQFRKAESRFTMGPLRKKRG